MQAEVVEGQHLQATIPVLCRRLSIDFDRDWTNCLRTLNRMQVKRSWLIPIWG